MENNVGSNFVLLSALAFVFWFAFGPYFVTRMPHDGSRIAALAVLVALPALFVVGVASFEKPLASPARPVAAKSTRPRLTVAPFKGDVNRRFMAGKNRLLVVCRRDINARALGRRLTDREFLVGIRAAAAHYELARDYRDTRFLIGGATVAVADMNNALDSRLKGMSPLCDYIRPVGPDGEVLTSYP